MASYISNCLSYLRIPFLASSVLATLISLGLYFKQNELIYPRSIPLNARTEIPKPSQFGIQDFEELTIPTSDGESLNAFLIRPSNKQIARNVTFLMFHGNAGNIGHRVPIAKVLESSVGVNVLMLEYRGYGSSTGTPNEKGLSIDAQAGIDYIRQRTELQKTKIVIYGQSLGGAVGIDLAARNQHQGDLAALILENTFLNIRKLIPSALPPARFLAPFCHQIWPSEETIPQLKIPILFLSGLQDEIVPPSHMKQLYDACKAPVKVWKALPQGDHNNTVAEPGYFQFIEEFIRKYV
ncbi:MAG: hypothetical protein M1820_006499 [Bogoriella megaspora]|nr:MAG: hypothetical protein M1820_006499 [Bogoriella megaspora]